MPTPISKYGEFSLIDRLTKNNKTLCDNTIKAVGDDCAVLSRDGNTVTLITTDLLLEGIHFDLTYVPLKHLGYKSVVVNLSDIFAMNGKPEQITVSIGISSKFSVEQIEELYDGIYRACEKYQVDLIGGDTSASINGLMISITAIGVVEKKRIVYRKGAKINDLICISGNIGAAYMGLMLLEREKRVFMDTPDREFYPKFEGREYIIERQLKPEARADVIELLREINLQPTAMIDVSDGLSSELLHIAQKSNVGVTIYEDKLPIDYETHAQAEQMNINPLTAGLNGGEDYELLFTLPLSSYNIIHQIEGIHIIGKVTDSSEGCRIITRSDEEIPLIAQGWNATNAL